MGCGVSRIDTNGMAFTARLRPIFPDISVKKHMRSTTMSKKKLLSHKSDTSDGSKTAPSSLEGSVSNDGKVKEPQQKEAEKSKDEASAKENGIASSSGNEINVTKEEISGENVIKDNEDYTSEDVFTDADYGEEDEDDDDDRMIGHSNDEAFAGSPSFRIYYKDNTEDEHDDEIGKNDCFEDAMPYDDDVSVSPKESSEPEDKKSIMRKKKRRSFKKVFPKGRQMKSLLSMKSCYCSPYSSHDQTQLLRERTNA